MTTLAVRARSRRSSGASDSSPSRRRPRRGRDARASSRAIRSPSGSAAALSDEQTHALEVITGPERAAILVGPAGTGKGVVIDAAARAEQLTGHQTFGIAVSGSTAQRLGQDSPGARRADAHARRARRTRRARAAARSTRTRRSTSMRRGWPTPTASTGSPRSWSAPAQSSSRSATPRSSPRSAPAACSTGSPQIAPSAELSNVRRTLDPGRTARVGGPARRALGPGDGALPRPRPAAHGRHPRRGSRASRPELGGSSPRPIRSARSH